MPARDAGLEAFVREVQLVGGRLHPTPADLSDVEALIAAVPAIKSPGAIAIACATLLDLVVRILLQHPSTNTTTLAAAVRVCAHLDLAALGALLATSLQQLQNRADADDPESDRRIRETLQIIAEQHPNSGLTIQSVAVKVGLSRWHLDRLLVKRTGQTFRKHLTRIRLSHATTLLAGGFCSIKQTAHQCGYGSVESLERAFRRAFGCSPTQWRGGPTKRPRIVEE